MRYIIYIAALVFIALMREYGYCLHTPPDTLVAGFESQGYTYGAMWFFKWMRVLEFVALSFLYIEIRGKKYAHLLIIPAVLAAFKILDEKTIPFDKYSWQEACAAGIAITLSVTEWKRTKKQA